jgi:hypothetical protein
MITESSLSKEISFFKKPPNLTTQHIEDFLLKWNLRYKFDRDYRKKYKIGFLSTPHKQLCYIDIFLDIYEDRLADKYSEEYKKASLDREDYNQTGRWLRERVESTEEIESKLGRMTYG